jgi:hypothetical protein
MEPYRVPFLFDRSGAPVYRLVNVGPERLRGVTITLMGSGVMSPTLPGALGPSEAIELRILGDRLQQDATLQVRWLRPDGADFLWRVAF